MTWLAFYRDNVNGDFKYIFLAPSSRFKGESDVKKYTKVSRTHNCDGVACLVTAARCSRAHPAVFPPRVTVTSLSWFLGSEAEELHRGDSQKLSHRNGVEAFTVPPASHGYLSHRFPRPACRKRKGQERSGRHGEDATAAAALGPPCALRVGRLILLSACLR